MASDDIRLVQIAALDCLVRPAAMAHSASPPLLCFLHGYDEGAPREIYAALTKHGPLRSGNSPVTEQFVIIAPQLPRRGDIWKLHVEAVAEIIAAQVKKSGCDPRRIYLTGFSFGGNGVFDLALLRPELWTALWPVDPTRVPPKPIDLPVWLSLGQISRFRARSFIQQLGLKPADPANSSDRVWTDDGKDHVGTATLAYRGAGIYEWLLTKRRP